MSKRYKIYGLEWLMVAPHKFDLANNEAIDFSCNDNKPFVLYRDINDVLKQLSINSNYIVYWVSIPKKIEDVVSAIDDNGNDCLNQIDPNDIEESLGRISNRAIDGCTTNDKIEDYVDMLTPENDIDKILKLSQNCTSIKTCELKRVHLLSELQTTYYVVVGENHNEGGKVTHQDFFRNYVFEKIEDISEALRDEMNMFMLEYGGRGKVFEVFWLDLIKYYKGTISRIPLIKLVSIIKPTPNV